jgi:hypothetical protein
MNRKEPYQFRLLTNFFSVSEIHKVMKEKIHVSYLELDQYFRFHISPIYAVAG